MSKCLSTFMPGDSTDLVSEMLHSVWNTTEWTKYRGSIILNGFT